MTIQSIRPTASKINFGTSSSKKFSVNAMAPLEINKESEWKTFEKNIKAAKEKGVDGISVDVWWGKVEGEEDNKFNWDYYNKIFKLIADNDLKIIPILSFHKCGDNVGDGDGDAYNPIPEWTWEYLANSLGKDYKGEETKKELMYKNESGDYSDDVIPVWYDDRMAIQYAEFMKEFEKHYANYADKISEINISMGPTGELRYPAYFSKEFDYPNRAGFVGYNEGGVDAFRTYAETKYGLDEAEISKKWNIDERYFDFAKIKPPSKSDTNTPKQADEFVKAHCYTNTQYGRDFINFYNYELVKHLRKQLNLANEVFKNGPLSKIDIGLKLPGVHWQIGMKPMENNDKTIKNPRISEIATGLITTDIDFQSKETDYGYKNILNEMQKFKEKWSNQKDLIFHFTSLEQDNQAFTDNGEKVGSRAKDLVNAMLDGAKKRNITIKGENALGGNLHPENKAGWDNMTEAIDNGYDGITFLRVGNLMKNESFDKLMQWKKETFE